MCSFWLFGIHSSSIFLRPIPFAACSCATENLFIRNHVIFSSVISTHSVQYTVHVIIYLIIYAILTQKRSKILDLSTFMQLFPFVCIYSRRLIVCCCNTLVSIQSLSCYCFTQFVNILNGVFFRNSSIQNVCSSTYDLNLFDNVCDIFDIECDSTAKSSA